MRKPTPADLLAARGTTVPDVIARGLRVLFCGINPSLYSAAVGHHFARPGNRFWPTLHAAGFTPRRLRPDEGVTLLALGYGVTNVVDRATARADELTPAEVIAGGVSLVRKVKRFRPQVLAVLGVTVYRQAFDRPKAVIGPQPDPMGGGRVWVLPNPSGLNAHYQSAALARVFAELRAAVV
jgi:TDG/mug DNA glycosylase family protein